MAQNAATAMLDSFRVAAGARMVPMPHWVIGMGRSLRSQPVGLHSFRSAMQIVSLCAPPWLTRRTSSRR